MALLEIRNLSVGAPDGKRIVDDVSLQVQRSEFVSVVGESGSGKTMIARSILRLLPEPVGQVSGSIWFDGKDLATLGARELRAIRGGKIGMVFQEPMASLNPAMTIGAQMAIGLRHHTDLPNEEIRRLCREMLVRVKIDRPDQCLDAYPHEFSGGMRQRIMLASVMMLRPQLLIADEPTTALDTITQQEVFDIMMSLTRDVGTAVLMISHNLGLVSRYSDRVVVMQKGRLVESGTVHAVMTTPSDPYTRQLIAALPARCPRAPVARKGDPLLSIRNLVVVHPGRKRWLGQSTAPVTAVDDVTLDIHPGETVAIVGGSGSGKTTLGRAIVGLVKPERGQIFFRSVDVLAAKGHGYRDYRLGCQMIFQDPYSSMNPRMRVEAIVSEPLRNVSGMSRAERARRVAATLEEVRLDGLAARFPHQLSGGQRQRVAIARAIVTRPALILADEPISALDMTVQQQILELFQRLQRDHGFACLFVSHDLAAVEQISDRVVVMHKGRVVETNDRDSIFDSPSHAYTSELLQASPEAGFARMFQAATGGAL